MRYKLTLIFAAIVAFLGAVFAGALFYLSDLLLFPFKEREKWLAVETIECTKWMREYAFADLREGFPSNKPLDMSCDDALNLPSQSFYTKNKRDERIHYKVYDNLVDSQSSMGLNPPLFFHVHGVSGTHMHGARYFKMASRLGFQLVAMDMSNHGLSDHNGLGASYGCREKDDVLAVLDALKAQFPGRQILLHATSMGSMASLNASGVFLSDETNSGVRTVVALALENPIPSVRELVLSTPKRPPAPQGFINLGVLLAERRGRVDFETCEPIAAAPKVNVPTYVYNSVNDDIVAPEVSRKIADAIPQEHMFRVKVFNKGAHSTVWNGNPTEVEQDLADLWKVAVPANAVKGVAPSTLTVPAVQAPAAELSK